MNITTQSSRIAPAKATDRPRLDAGAATLWASAFVILAMILTHAGSAPSPSAYAGLVADVGQLKILTAQSGNNEEFIAILNSTDETLSIYGIENARSLELYQVQPLKDVFLSLSRAAGVPRR